MFIPGKKIAINIGITVATLIQIECGGGVDMRMNIANTALKVASIRANMRIAPNAATTTSSLRPKAYLGQNHGNTNAIATTAVKEKQIRCNLIEFIHVILFNNSISTIAYQQS